MANNKQRYQPGMRSAYGGIIVDRGGDTSTLRVLPVRCARCNGAGRLGDEVFCSICQGMRYTDPSQAYEPYYETAKGTIRSSLPSNRSYIDRSEHPAHAKSTTPAPPTATAPAAGGVKTRTSSTGSAAKPRATRTTKVQK